MCIRDRPRPAAPAPGPGGAAAGAARRLANHRVVLMLDLKLALKLAVAVALLGQDAGLGRACFLAGAAVVAFLFQTGLLALGLAALAESDAAQSLKESYAAAQKSEAYQKAAAKGAELDIAPHNYTGRTYTQLHRTQSNTALKVTATAADPKSSNAMDQPSP